MIRLHICIFAGLYEASVPPGWISDGEEGRSTAAGDTRHVRAPARHSAFHTQVLHTAVTGAPHLSKYKLLGVLTSSCLS